MTWRLARSLEVLRDEVNAAAPGRSKISDGTIGDAAHASRDSDHNPWVVDAGGTPVVRAMDITHDPGGGCDCRQLAEHIRRLGQRNGHPALGPGAYVIFEGRIASDTEDGAPWDWESYHGSNGHYKHCHISVALWQEGYDSPQPWGVMEDDMAQYDVKFDTMIRMLEASKRREVANRKAVRQLANMVSDLGEVVAAGDQKMLNRITKAKREILNALPDESEAEPT